MDPYVGQIIAVGFNFAPVGWVLCNGQFLAISEYQVLYTLIGTTFGGNGQTNFAVPNLCGRSPIGLGTGTGQPTYTMGQTGGTELNTLLSTQLPSHTHTLGASTTAATASVPSGLWCWARPTNPNIEIYGTVTSTTTPLSNTSISLLGGNLPHENRQPYNTVNYIICTAGIYPSQS